MKFYSFDLHFDTRRIKICPKTGHETRLCRRYSLNKEREISVGLNDRLINEQSSDSEERLSLIVRPLKRFS